MENEVPNQNPAGTSQPETQEASGSTVSPAQAVVNDGGDCKPKTPKKATSAATEETGTSQTETKEASETTVSPNQDDQIDGCQGEKSEEISAMDNTDCQSGDEFNEGELSANTNQDGSCEENLDSDQAPCQEVTAVTALPSQRADCSDTIQDRDSSETEVRSVAETNSPIKDSTRTEKKSNQSQTDGKQLLPKTEKQVTIAPKSEERRDKPESTTQDKQQLDVRSNDVENIGPNTPEATQPEDPQVTGGSGKCWLGVAIAVGIAVAIAAIVLQHFLQPESPLQTNDVRQIDVFLRQLEKVKTRFPNQRAELWNRGRIHLKRHLQTTQPTEPVSLILTAGLRAEKTLNCLARDLASAYSSARNASVLHIDGASKASQDSDQVKLDIDRKLQGAFEGDKPVAVIHRFEELPPGSTLIFYRYCDHENAAYKNTFLIFTVLLGEEDEIPAKISLCAVEEMVDDHLQKKFLTHGHPVSFDMMDLDKYGGLWSRISHLILPVAAEERIELEGC
ncbi:torsin-1A-interacting protein 2 isoform X2 [Oreochromis niloticus]|uniref:Torsin-1A-interacting protein 1/2 AAA+ activator domain-containing protein n=1 Tax=Oreochromis aureus TaxID=47969 RepID=A0A668SD80_OREAU|nr:torsin-1A-interacting protein 2 isoform X2 [Oreochromis niloticus]XP_031592486.1 torsin-1A-interacting protein 2-like [Oreochromis aureus]